MKKTALIIMIITLISKVFGFARELTLSYFYGVSNVSDAYIISMTIPSVIFGFISAGLAAGYIPVLSNVIHTQGEKEANLFTNKLVSFLMFISSFIVFIGLFFTDQIVKIFASGFDGETLALTVQFTRISLVAVYFMAMVSIFSGYLQIKKKYIIPALVGIPFNFIIALSIVISQTTGLIIMPIGFVIATAFQLVIMLKYIKKNGYIHKFIFDIKDKNLVYMMSLITPIIIGTSVNQINMLVDRTIASRLAIGGITSLNYANRIITFAMGIFVVSIITALYPEMSNLASSKNIKGLKNSFSNAIIGILLLIIPVTIGFLVFVLPIVTMLFGRGAFDNRAIMMTSSALFFYSFGMIGFGLREVISRAFYSIQDTKTPMINAAIGMGLNVVLNILLSRYLGIGGLALATSISAIFTTGLLFKSFRKKVGSFGMKQISISFLKVLFASLIMGFISKMSFNHLASILTQNISLLIAISIGAISYFFIIYFMKIDEVDLIIQAFKKKLGRGVA